jgi:hypothetical protein
MCEAPLEALVRHLKTFTLLQGTRHATFDARLQTKPSERREKPAFRRREEEKGQTQPQLYGTQYFSVRIALTGQLGCGDWGQDCPGQCLIASRDGGHTSY